MLLTNYPGKPNKLPWYKKYGFNTEQEFEQWWAKYGAKLKLNFPTVSAGQYSSYQEYLQREAIDRAKRAFQSPSHCLFGKSLKIKTADGKTWTFDAAEIDVYPRKTLCRGPLGEYKLAKNRGVNIKYPSPGGGPEDELYALCWLATSPLIVSIEASDEVIKIPLNVEGIPQEAIELGKKNIVYGHAFPQFWIWIMSGRLPLTLTVISKDFPMDQHPPVVPPPYAITPSTSQTPPPTGGTTTGGTTTGGTTTGGTTTGGTTTGGTTTGGTTTGGTTTGGTTTGGTTTGGTTTTAVVKSALPYVAIGAGVLLLLWAMKK
jgi:hypothetical protein